MKSKSVLLILTSILVCSKTEAQIPSISFKEFNQNLVRGDLKSLASKLQDPGGKFGVFVVQDLGEEYEKALQRFIDKNPDCLRRNEENLPKLILGDGSAERITYATNSRGRSKNLKEFVLCNLFKLSCVINPEISYHG